MHVPVASSVLLTQRRFFPTIVLLPGPNNQSQSAVGELAAAIVDWIGFSMMRSTVKVTK